MMQDYTTLANPKFLYFAETQHPFPDWAASVPLPTVASFEKCASTAFADSERRLLPIRDRVSTFHSAIDLFANIAEHTAATFERVKSACAFFNIEVDVAPYATIFADDFEKQASTCVAPVGSYAIDQHINGVHYQILPLNDAQDVQDSAHELAKMATENRIHFLSLIPASRHIVKAAEKFNVTNVTPVISRLGLERCANLEKVAHYLQGREAMAKKGDAVTIKAEYDAIVADVKAGGITPDQCMQKIAALDDAVGIRCHFDAASQVMNPFEIVFSGPLINEVEKAARLNVAIKDVLIPLPVLKSIDVEEATFKLSKSAGHAFKQLADTEDAKDLSLTIMGWDDADQRTLLRMAAAL